MDPYETLGVMRGASQDEIKTAFRREAMKYHPDRSDNSPASIERFQELSRAYQMVSRKFRNSVHWREDESAAGWNEADYRYDDELWNLMLEYAIELVRSGLDTQQVAGKLQENGCYPTMANAIAMRAEHFQDYLNAIAIRKQQRHQNSPDNAGQLTYDQLLGAFVGNGKPEEFTQANRYYQNIFGDLARVERADSLFTVSKNRYLKKIFNRSLLLMLLLAALAYFLPGLMRYIPLSDIDLFQLPNILLSLMLVWTFYRKTWLLATVAILLFALNQVYYYYAIPSALNKNFIPMLLTAVVGFLPFLFLTHFSNFFYYRKARDTIASVSQDYADLAERKALLKKLGGTSRIAAMCCVALLTIYFMHMIPRTGSLENKLAWLLRGQHANVESRDIQLASDRVNESLRLFEKGEQLSQGNAADLRAAELAFIRAAEHGSLLAAYKLGYMYLLGRGVHQDDRKAFEYFSRAINAPLAHQPHRLDTTTHWLSEAYTGLGVMYLGGYGTRANREKAAQMFREAVKYGSDNARLLLAQSAASQSANLKTLVAAPEFGR